MQVSKTDYGFHVTLDAKFATAHGIRDAATRIWGISGKFVSGWAVETIAHELFFFDPALDETYLDHEPLT
jgi:hypothetical protein